MGSPFADRSAAAEAVERSLPMIEAALRDRTVSGTGFLCIVVLDPCARPGEQSFEDALVLEHPIGERTAWDADYAQFARAKARLTWERGLDSHLVQTTLAHRLRAGDTLLWGSVCLDGIVVAVSGAQPWWDEAFATCIAANLRAIAKARQAAALAQKRLYV